MKTGLAARHLAWQCQSCRPQSTRSLTLPIRTFSSSTRRREEATEGGPIKAAAPFDFSKIGTGNMSLDANPFAGEEDGQGQLLKNARLVPASPSYFTAKPHFIDASLELQSLYRRYQNLPALTPAATPRTAWKKLSDFRNSVGEPVKAAKYRSIVELLRRLNRIHPALMPEEVSEALAKHRRAIDPKAVVRTPAELDEAGRAKGVGYRKASSARVLLVEGDGEVLINGQSINAVFGRIHDRESALWALKATDRLDKYNVWALVTGGGTTGQAEAITLAVARALLVHEPALKPALRRAGCITRDPRRVERKKPGRLKARKMPTWVKR